MFKKWNSIENFRNFYKELIRYIEYNGSKFSDFNFYLKVKLHGTNAAIGVSKDGHLFAQKRNSITTIKDCSTGFAQFVADLDEQLDHVRGDLKTVAGQILFGEWIGPGVQKGTSASLIPDKFFATYALHNPNAVTNFIISYDDQLLPRYLSNITDRIGSIPVSEQVHIDILDQESLKLAREKMDSLVVQIEKVDPYIKNLFGIEGPGEGYVAYSFDHMRLVDGIYHPHKFKIKTEKFAETKSSAGSNVDYEKYAAINTLAFDLCTEARLEQAISEVDHNDFDMKKIPDFLRWVANDIEKECLNEIEASGFAHKDVFRAISKIARDFYVEQTKKL